MKAIISSFLFFFCLPSYAQKDSLRKFKLTAIQLEHAIIGEGRIPLLNLNSIRNAVPASAIVTRDLSGFTSGLGYGLVNPFVYNNYIGFKLVTDLKTKRKNNPELFIGLRLGNKLFSTISFNKSSKTETYYNSTSSSETLVKYSYIDTSYYFSISGRSLFIPFGLNFTSNKTKRFWLSAGLELAPQISFWHTFHEVVSTSTYSIVTPISVPEKEIYKSRSNDGSSFIKSNTYRLGGMGFGFYLAIPLTVHVRLSKRIKILKNMSASASITPAYSYTYYKNSGTNDGFINFLFFGIRYAL